MKLFKKSISAKISLLYLMLAIINMSFFTIVIYENQIELITENTKYNITEITGSLISSLDKINKDESRIKKKKISRKKKLKEISSIISKVSDRFIIFTEKGKVIYKSDKKLETENKDILYGIRSITNMDFTGKRFYSHIDEDTLDLSFYIPFNLISRDKSIILIKFKIDAISNRLNRLYRLITIIVAIISIFHLFFALLLFRMLINPIKALHGKSVAISQGDLTARSEIKRHDEIGELSTAFNIMADSVADKINSLQKQRSIMEDELTMASKVQEVIFPHIKNNSQFDFAVYNRAAEKVSGDYYDIFDIGDSRFGFLMVDVQGHGVPAAMITMLIKEKFRQNSDLHHDPSALFKKVNDEIYEILNEGATDSGLFFTAFYMTIDGDLNLQTVDAGHLRPFLIRRKKHELSLLKSGGIPMGISDEMDELYITHSTKILSGDKVILYTDGIIEARNSKGAEFGINGFTKLIKSHFKEEPKILLESVIKEFSMFTDIEDLKDDATVLIIEVK